MSTLSVWELLATSGVWHVDVAISMPLPLLCYSCECLAFQTTNAGRDELLMPLLHSTSLGVCFFVNLLSKQTSCCHILSRFVTT